MVCCVMCMQGLRFYDSARGLFDEMPVKNVVSWTSLMVGYGDNGNFEEVVKMLIVIRTRLLQSLLLVGH